MIAEITARRRSPEGYGDGVRRNGNQPRQLEAKRSGRAFMPLAATASRTDRERAIASVEMLISKHEATAAAHELAGQLKRAEGWRRLVAELREILATMRDSPSG